MISSNILWLAVAATYCCLFCYVSEVQSLPTILEEPKNGKDISGLSYKDTLRFIKKATKNVRCKKPALTLVNIGSKKDIVGLPGSSFIDYADMSPMKLSVKRCLSQCKHCADGKTCQSHKGRHAKSFRTIKLFPRREYRSLDNRCVRVQVKEHRRCVCAVPSHTSKPSNIDSFKFMEEVDCNDPVTHAENKIRGHKKRRFGSYASTGDSNIDYDAGNDIDSDT